MRARGYDENDYPLVVLDVQHHKPPVIFDPETLSLLPRCSDKYHEMTKGITFFPFVTVVAKLMKETDDGYLVKFFEPRMVNHGSGSTLPNYYAFMKKNGDMCSYFRDEDYTERDLMDFTVKYCEHFMPLKWRESAEPLQGYKTI